MYNKNFIYRVSVNYSSPAITGSLYDVPFHSHDLSQCVKFVRDLIKNHEVLRFTVPYDGDEHDFVLPENPCFFICIGKKPITDCNTKTIWFSRIYSCENN